MGNNAQLFKTTHHTHLLHHQHHKHCTAYRYLLLEKLTPTDTHTDMTPCKQTSHTLLLNRETLLHWQLRWDGLRDGLHATLNTRKKWANNISHDMIKQELTQTHADHVTKTQIKHICIAIIFNIGSDYVINLPNHKLSSFSWAVVSQTSHHICHFIHLNCLQMLFPV